MTIPIVLNQQVFFEGASKVICVGRNYADHAKEMNSPIPEEPILFIKPATALVHFSDTVVIPKNFGSVHHELEIALLIKDTLNKASTEEALNNIAGIGLGLDLTLRDLQKTLKTKGHPWERAKAFDGSCPLTEFICPPDLRERLTQGELQLTLNKNAQVQQQGHYRDMLFSPEELIVFISQFFTLNKGDVILTGTPSGVGPVNDGDKLSASLTSRGQTLLNCECSITH